MIRTIILAFLIFPVSIFSQILTLEESINIAVRAYPLQKQKTLYSGIIERKIENLNTKYLPEIQLLAQAQYQSDVTKVELNIPIPGITIPEIPSPSKDQYKVGLNLNQIIFDGGIISSQKEVESLQYQLNIKNLDAELYKIKQKVSDTYFAILQLNAKINSLELLKSDLSLQRELLKKRVEGGIILKTNLDFLDVEILKLELNIDELKSSKEAAIKVLSILLNREIENTIELDIPNPGIEVNNSTDFSKRLEFVAFKTNKEYIKKIGEISDAKIIPKLSLYGQAFYGKPGLNMFDPDFAFFWIVGLRASWNFLNWGESSREKEILNLQTNLIETQEEVFELNLNLALTSVINDQAKLSEFIEKDKKIIELRKTVSANYASQLENGIITMTEFILQKNAEQQAMLSLENHKIELAKVKVNYLLLKGEF